MRTWEIAMAVIDRRCAVLLLALAAAVALMRIPDALSEEDYSSWVILKNPFESTGGGGVMIGEYNPVIVGNKCVTNFTATTPDGKVYHNVVEFETVQVQGGTLCTNGAWRARDGSASGTTPFRVFIKDGTAGRRDAIPRMSGSRAASRQAGVPLSKPSTLKSSSISGQWMPCPAAQGSHVARSCGTSCLSRGYHSSGTAILRPSLRSTSSQSSVTRTSSTRLSGFTASVLMPSFRICFMLAYLSMKPVQLAIRVAEIGCQLNRGQPELGRMACLIDVDM